MNTKKVTEFNRMVKSFGQSLYIFYNEKTGDERKKGYIAYGFYEKQPDKVQTAIFGKTKKEAIARFKKRR